LTGVLTPQETFSGLSRSAVITVLAIFILAEGLRRTGVTNRVGNVLAHISGSNETRLSVYGMLSGAFLSLFMNNIAAASVLLPAITSAARKARINPTRLLMPLAFSTLLGGMATLFTTTNIIVNGVLRENDLPGFGILDFAPVGLPIVLVGVAYLAGVGLWLLPLRQPSLTTPVTSLVDIYRLAERFVRCRIVPGSRLVGLTLAESNLRQDFNLNLVSIERNGDLISFPVPSTTFQPGDILLLEGKMRQIIHKDFRGLFEIIGPSKRQDDFLNDSDILMVEALLAPRSSLIGKTLRDAQFRAKYNLNVVGIYRAGRPMRTGLSDLTLQFGDALLLHGPRRQVQLLSTEPDLIVLGSDMRGDPPNPGKSRHALIIMTGTLLVGLFPAFSIAEVMLGGALVMIATRVLSMDQAYQSIDWRTVFLIAGMLPLGTALSKTGIASNLASAMVDLIGQAGPYALLAGILLVTILLSQVMHSGVVATIMAPIAIEIALHSGFDPRSISMGVALATSMTFLTPLGHPVNMLVMSPGGYRFTDYLRVGLPLTILIFSIIMLLMPLIWPL
jgi:di/tricarboxylate transporter